MNFVSDSKATILGFETAQPGDAAEKSGVSIGYFPPYGESQGLLEMHKWPFMPPNGAISAEQCCRERYLMTAWRRGRDSNPRDPFGPNGFQDRRFQPLTHPSVSDYKLQRDSGMCLVGETVSNVFRLRWPKVASSEEANGAVLGHKLLGKRIACRLNRLRKKRLICHSERSEVSLM